MRLYFTPNGLLTSLFMVGSSPELSMMGPSVHVAINGITKKSDVHACYRANHSYKMGWEFVMYKRQLRCNGNSGFDRRNATSRIDTPAEPNPSKFGDVIPLPFRTLGSRLRDLKTRKMTFCCSTKNCFQRVSERPGLPDCPSFAGCTSLPPFDVVHNRCPTASEPRTRKTPHHAVVPLNWKRRPAT
jgi:hypothetical protein